MLTSRLALLLSFAAPVALAQAPAPAAPTAPPRIDERVLQIPQTAPGTIWSFIGYSIKTPTDPQWFVANGTPRGGTMGRQNTKGSDAGSAVLVFGGDLLKKPVNTDAELLEVARERHAKIGERWKIDRHDEKIVRHAGTRCARHFIEAREPEDRSPRNDTAKANEGRSWLHVVGISCVHPTDPNVLIEIGASERSFRPAMSPAIVRDADQVISSLAFQRFNEQAMQKAAEAARTTHLADAETVLKPYVDADAAWARYFLAQILQRAQPAPANVGPRIKSQLEAASARGLPDAQWALGTLLLRGADGVPADPKAAEAWLRKAAERGNPGAAFQLGIALLSNADGIAAKPQEAVLWIQRSAARGQKEAQEMLKGVAGQRKTEGAPDTSTAPPTDPTGAVRRDAPAPGAPASSAPRQ